MYNGAVRFVNEIIIVSWEREKIMGMTDRQFDEYRKNLLREMKRMRKKAEKEPKEMLEDFDEMMNDLEESLKRP